MNVLDESVYVAYHGKVKLKGAVDSHKLGMRVQLVLEREEDYKTFKDVFRRSRKGKSGSGIYLAFIKSPGEEEWWSSNLEMRFMGWSISSFLGAVVTFQFDDDEYWKRFRQGMAVDLGYELEALKPYELVLVPLSDEGKPINVAQQAKLERARLKSLWPPGGPQSKRAAILCNDIDFINWLGMRKLVDPKTCTPADVAEWMRKECGIDSRAQLDHDEDALVRFEEKIAKPFMRHFAGERP
jgi:hypothetical protein